MRPSATDAVRRHLIASLEKRAADQGAAVRGVIEAKLARLRAEDAAHVDVRGASDTGANHGASLRSLVADLGSQASTRNGGKRSMYPELPALDDFQAIWSALRTENQWRQSLVDAPENAGPLNSSALVHRAIALMRDLSPGYLQHFLAYVDDLAWLGQIGDDAPAIGAGAPRPTAPGKRVRKKAPKSKA
jgi:hypothetical protein